MRLAQLPLVTPLVRLARSARELLNPLAQITAPATLCSSMRNEPERRPARDPGPAPIASPFLSRWRAEIQIAGVAVSQFLARERWARSSQGFRGVFCRAAQLLCGLVSRVTTSSLLPYVLFPATGAD